MIALPSALNDHDDRNQRECRRTLELVLNRLEARVRALEAAQGN